MPVLTADQKAERKEVAEELLSNQGYYLDKLVWWDHTSFGVAEAGLRDTVWASKGQGRPVEVSKLHSRGAKFRAAGCLCGVSYKKGTIGPFRNAPPGKHKVRSRFTPDNLGRASRRAWRQQGGVNSP